MTQDEIKEVFTYDDEEGALRWKIKPSKRHSVGDIAGSTNRYGYRVVRYKSKEYSVHRLIWIYHNGSIPEAVQVDHRDRNRRNNHIINLRLLSIPKQRVNGDQLGFNYRTNSERRKPKDRIFKTRDKPWYATIKKDGKSIALGAYSSAFEARLAYEVAAIEFFGDALQKRWAYGLYVGIINLAFS